VTQESFLQDHEELLLLLLALLPVIVCLSGFGLPEHLHQGIGSGISEPLLQRTRHRQHCHASQPSGDHPAGVNRRIDILIVRFRRSS
jgi:hypothetical protein